MSSRREPAARRATSPVSAHRPRHVPASRRSRGTHDAIVVGSGFGGTMAAWTLHRAGMRVLLLERGEWVERGPWNWGAEGLGEATPHFVRCHQIDRGRKRPGQAGSFHCVGGPSVFYGGVSLRFRPEDFAWDPHIGPETVARWPIRYPAMEPWYRRAERIIGVAAMGDGGPGPGRDPLDPPGTHGYPETPGRELATVARRIADAGRRLGHVPFRLPLAINHGAAEDRSACVGCATCDGFPCAIGAKNDLASSVLAPLVRDGLDLRTGTAVRRLRLTGGVVSGVEAVDLRTGESLDFRAPVVVVAAGAVATPVLLLASGLGEAGPGGAVVGRYLMRHCNGSVYGVFRRLDGADDHHKQVGFNDLYFGAREAGAPAGKLGNVQQVPTPAPAYAEVHLPGWLGHRLGGALRHLTGLLCIAEDQPIRENRVELADETDAHGLPRARIVHRHTERDRAARRFLMRRAKAILKEAGAVACYRHTIDTFSHACGTVRMGDDPDCSALDPDGRFRGVPGLWVTDGSAMPRSSGLNPSLTIAANALRIADGIVREA